MHTSNLRVGVVIANYNNGPYIRECINSLMYQSRKPNVIAFVDDCSVDDSMDIIKSYRENPVDKSIELMIATTKENSGPSVARNIGLNYLLDKTDVIFTIDSDDIYYKDKIKKSLVPFVTYPQVAGVYTDYDVIYMKDGNRTMREFKEPFNYQRLIEECIIPNNSAQATSVIKQVGLYDETIDRAEDYDMWLRIAEVGAIYHIPESLCGYRMTGNNITMNTPSEHYQFCREIVRRKFLERYNGKK